MVNQDDLATFLSLSNEELKNEPTSTTDVEQKVNVEEKKDTIKEQELTVPLVDLSLIYIHYVGTNSEGLNIYHFLLSDNPDEAAAEGWYEVPACNEPRELMKPDDTLYTAIKEWKTKIRLDLAQDNCCFSFQDAKDHILSLGFENISDYEEYPEPIRLIFYYGESINEIDSDLATRNEIAKWLPKKYVEPND